MILIFFFDSKTYTNSGKILLKYNCDPESMNKLIHNCKNILKLGLIILKGIAATSKVAILLINAHKSALYSDTRKFKYMQLYHCSLMCA